MSEIELTCLVIGSIVLALINSIRAAHWKAKYETLDKERNFSGWEDECRFLRRIVNKEAAEYAES